MNKILALFFILMSTALPCKAHIMQVQHFQELTHHCTQDTLVILDIDDTLLLPTQTLGTDVWFCHRLDEYKSQGMPSEIALEKALAEWQAIRHLTKVQLVEQDTDKIVRDMQERGIAVMGLTTQGLALATRTVQQLTSLGIDLTRSSPYKEDLYFLNNRHGVLYRHGILFTSGSPKGPALMTLLRSIGAHPKSIIFINDKESHLLDVGASVEKAQIPFLGLRYGFGDARVAQYRKEITEIQFMHSHFGHILSDEEAEALLATFQGQSLPKEG